MAQQTAKLSYLKIAPRKVRLVANTLKGLPVQEAEAQLLLRPQRSAPALLKLLRSAVANAKNRNVDSAKLYVVGVKVDQGPMLKRIRPRAMGRATAIQKKMSHVTLILEEKPAAVPRRFSIVVPKKEKKGKKVSAKSKPPVKETVKKEEEKPGFFKKLFRRKSV